MSELEFPQLSLTMPRLLCEGARCAIVALGAITLNGCATPGLGVELENRSKPLLTIDGLTFRDLQADGELAPYEDWRLSDEARVDDLIARMTIEEKVGTLMHSTLPGAGGAMGQATSYDKDALDGLLADKHVTSFITRLSLPAAELATQNNAVQEAAEATRLGIPVTISTDPRHHFQYVLGVSESSVDMTQWPELLGFAALGDEDLVRQFGDISRQEYRAVGIHMTLSPQLDLATEPRWARITGTFGSDAELTSRMGAAYVTGFQGGPDGLQEDGVLAVVKHWVGYGAQPEGFDAHNYYGRFVRPGDAIDLHIEAFRGALAANAGGVMPAYPILQDTNILGQPADDVSPGYSSLLLQDLLRDEFGFDGILLSDWAITRDCNERCKNPTEEAPQRPQDIATSWGVEDLTVRQRYVAGLEAGLDQFGGTDDVEPLVLAARTGDISAERLDQSVRRILLAKFHMGLFDAPYVDAQQASALVGQAEHRALADRTQREAQVLLKNEGGVLPLSSTRTKVWLEGMSAAAARAAGFDPVDDVADADFVLVRADAPGETLHPNHFFGRIYKEGRLDFRPGDTAYDALVSAPEGIPRILAVFLDRPAILADIQQHADVILANFGASDAAIFDVLRGATVPRGRLPFELPSSMLEVEEQLPGMPDDTPNPLYRTGSGIVPAGN